MKIFLILIFLYSSSALHFFLTEGKERCTYEEMGKNIKLTIKFRLMAPVLSNDPTIGVSIYIIDPTGIEVTRKLALYNEKDDFLLHHTTQNGLYKICTLTNSNGAWTRDTVKNIPFEMRVIMDDDELQRNNDAIKFDTLKSIEEDIRVLFKKTKRYLKMQTESVLRSTELYHDNHNINSKIIALTVFQSIIILIAGLFQIYRLRSYLIEKHLF